jgi:hypothetical protein
MLSKGAKKRLVRDFMGGHYVRTPAFNRFFKHVNGFEDPTSLVLREDADLEGRERLQFDDDFLEVARSFLKWEIEMLLHSQRNESRPLHWDGMDGRADLVKENYACLFFLNEQSGVKRVLEGHANAISASTLSVCDFGAGTGRAFTDLLREDVVCSATSAAVTLPSNQRRVCSSENMVYANIAHLAPQNGVSFDAIFSAYGALSYHPFSFNDTERYARFGLLQLLNFTNVGGLMFLAGRMCEARSIAVLKELGVIEEIAPIDFDAQKEKNGLQ